METNTQSVHIAKQYSALKLLKHVRCVIRTVSKAKSAELNKRHWCRLVTVTSYTTYAKRVPTSAWERDSRSDRASLSSLRITLSSSSFQDLTPYLRIQYKIYYSTLIAENITVRRKCRRKHVHPRQIVTCSGEIVQQNVSV